MSFLRKLFGGGNEKNKPVETVEYKDHTIEVAPKAEGGQFRLAALITADIDGEIKTHQLIRADTFPSKEDAAAASLKKAKQVIDEQGKSLFMH